MRDAVAKKVIANYLRHCELWQCKDKTKGHASETKRLQTSLMYQPRSERKNSLCTAQLTARFIKSSQLPELSIF